MSAEPREAREIRRFHAKLWKQLGTRHLGRGRVEDYIPGFRDSLANLIEQGYNLTEIGMMLGLTRERIRQFAVRLRLPRPMRHAARIWDDGRHRFVALPETVARRAERLGIAYRAERAAKRHQRYLDRCQVEFWAQVEFSNSCWLWQGFSWAAHGKDVRGAYRGEFVHRLSFLWANGYLPTGRTRGSLVVSHICDVGLCVNPDHLTLMTHKENIQDSIRKGRHSSVTKRLKSHCKYGHPIETYGDGKRRCRTCVNRHSREYYRQKVGAA